MFSWITILVGWEVTKDFVDMLKCWLRAFSYVFQALFWHHITTDNVSFLASIFILLQVYQNFIGCEAVAYEAEA